ncbi:hypothetical protein MMPV_004607 [Pyropia vietnamensis]
MWVSPADTGATLLMHIFSRFPAAYPPPGGVVQPVLSLRLTLTGCLLAGGVGVAPAGEGSSGAAGGALGGPGGSGAPGWGTMTPLGLRRLGVREMGTPLWTPSGGARGSGGGRGTLHIRPSWIAAVRVSWEAPLPVLCGRADMAKPDAVEMRMRLPVSGGVTAVSVLPDDTVLLLGKKVAWATRAHPTLERLWQFFTGLEARPLPPGEGGEADFPAGGETPTASPSADDLGVFADGGSAAAAVSTVATVTGGQTPRSGRRGLWRLRRSGWRRLEPTKTALKVGLRRLGDTDLPPGTSYTPRFELRATFSVTPSRLAVLDAREVLLELGLRDRAVYDAFSVALLLMPPASPLSRPAIIKASCWVRPSETLSAVRAKVMAVSRHWPRCRGFWAGFPGGGGGRRHDAGRGRPAWLGRPRWGDWCRGGVGGLGGAVVTEMGIEDGRSPWVAVSDEATVAEVGLTARHTLRYRGRGRMGDEGGGGGTGEGGMLAILPRGWGGRRGGEGGNPRASGGLGENRLM